MLCFVLWALCSSFLSIKIYVCTWIDLLFVNIFILNFIGEKIIFYCHWFMKDEEAIDWREKFPNFPWIRRTSSRKCHGRLIKGKVVSCVFFSKKKEDNKCVRGKLVLMCERMSFMKKKSAKKKHGRKLCVSNSCSRIHERISMNKPLDFYFKYMFLSDPPSDLSQTLNISV
jgi:hypothetical protein